MKKERKINLDILGNMIYALIIMVYFIFLLFGIKLVEEEILLKYIKISSMAFLILTILIFEDAYKDDNGKKAIHGIEFLILSIHAILLEYMSRVTNTQLNRYIAISAYAFAIYYVIKAMIIYTKYRKEQLDSLSDISEIVKEEPIKKEPTKKEK